MALFYVNRMQSSKDKRTPQGNSIKKRGYMPYLPKKACAKVGCPNLVEPGQTYCKLHKRKDTRKTANQRGYNYKWTVEKAKYLKQHPVCVKCGAKATVVDHIVPHRGNQGLFWMRENWAAMCATCHNRKTVREDGGFGNRRK